MTSWLGLGGGCGGGAESPLLLYWLLGVAIGSQWEGVTCSPLCVIGPPLITLSSFSTAVPRQHPKLSVGASLLERAEQFCTAG